MSAMVKKVPTHTKKSEPNTPVPLTDRMRTALAAGSAPALFPVLAQWSTEELRALITDIDVFHSKSQERIRKGEEQLLFTPAVFFSDKAANMVMNEAKAAYADLLIICAEISSVAIHMLHERGMDT